MARFIPLTPKRHGNKGLSPIRGYAFAASTSVVPIAAVEFARAATSMPLAFVEDEGAYKAVAVLSPVAGRDLFVTANGQWLGRYIPVLFRAYPFRLLRRGPASEDWVLCIDEACPELTDAGGDAQPLYMADGSLAPLVKAAADLLEGYERGRLLANKAVAALAEAGAICPWEIRIKLREGDQPARGLHRIDETALAKVSDETFLGLRRTSALPLAYAQLLSMAQLEVLQRLAGLHAEASRSRSPVVGPAGEGFNLTNADSLHFG